MKDLLKLPEIVVDGIACQVTPMRGVRPVAFWLGEPLLSFFARSMRLPAVTVECCGRRIWSWR
jgi:hypothetical protein